jgi:hypothetical protein
VWGRVPKFASFSKRDTTTTWFEISEIGIEDL